MFRNNYDTDISTWSPQGRLHQVEYAMEAVKQGGAVVGCKSKTHAVVATLKRPQNELAYSQQKIYRIDDHLGMAFAGLTSDGRSLCRYMRNECMHSRFVYEAPLPTARLVKRIADKSQVSTQREGSRPYGVGLLVIGHDQAGAHLYNTCPSGNYSEYHAMAIGGRSQAARTYFEKHFKTFEDCSVDQLLKHALTALAAGAQDELNAKNCCLAYVGEDIDFTILEDEKIAPYVEGLELAPAAAPADDTPAPMETS